MAQKRLVSGVKPTGEIHIGNYFGAMRQFVKLQDTHENFVFIADYHALTTNHVPQQLSEGILHIAAAYMAIGLDPEKTLLFQQSRISAHTELAWVFNCITSMGYLERGHAFKDAQAQKRDVTVGTFDYPMLMASDILLYDADVVPVGSDQKQHIEFARDTAGKFNHLFGDTFRTPEPFILDATATVPGIDGRKMSKSYGNTIPLFAGDEDITRSVMNIETDSKGVDEPKDAGNSTLIALHRLVSREDVQVEIERRFREGGIGYREVKDALAAELITFITPLRERYHELIADPGAVMAHVAAGSERAQKLADEKMRIVRERIGVTIREEL